MAENGKIVESKVPASSRKQNRKILFKRAVGGGASMPLIRNGEYQGAKKWN